MHPLGFCCSPPMSSRWCDLQGISVRHQGPVLERTQNQSAEKWRCYIILGRRGALSWPSRSQIVLLAGVRGGCTCHLSMKKDKLHPVSEAVTSCPSKEILVWVCDSIGKGWPRTSAQKRSMWLKLTLQNWCVLYLAGKPLGSSWVPEVGSSWVPEVGSSWKGCSRRYQRGQ